VIVVGIDGCCYNAGAGLSPRVAGAVPVATSIVLEGVTDVASERANEPL
jgi:hypothetical protein